MVKQTRNMCVYSSNLSKQKSFALPNLFFEIITCLKIPATWKLITAGYLVLRMQPIVCRWYGTNQQTTCRRSKVKGVKKWFIQYSITVERKQIFSHDYYLHLSPVHSIKKTLQLYYRVSNKKVFLSLSNPESKKSIRKKFDLDAEVWIIHQFFLPFPHVCLTPSTTRWTSTTTSTPCICKSSK